MDTEALIELYLRSAGWTKVCGLTAELTDVWDHEHVEVFKTTEEATVITQEWGDLAFDDDGPEPKEDDCA